MPRAGSQYPQSRFPAGIDWATVVVAGLLGVAVIVPAAAVAAAVTDADGLSDGWQLGFVALVVAGLALAGFRAGWVQSATPIAHGGLAAGLALVVAVVAGWIIRVVDGGGTGSLELGGLAVLAAVAAFCGVGGAVAADWVRRRAIRGRSTS